MPRKTERLAPAMLEAAKLATGRGFETLRSVAPNGA